MVAGVDDRRTRRTLRIETVDQAVAVVVDLVVADLAAGRDALARAGDTLVTDRADATVVTHGAVGRVGIRALARELVARSRDVTRVERGTHHRSARADPRLAGVTGGALAAVVARAAVRHRRRALTGGGEAGTGRVALVAIVADDRSARADSCLAGVAGGAQAVVVARAAVRYRRRALSGR